MQARRRFGNSGNTGAIISGYSSSTLVTNHELSDRQNSSTDLKGLSSEFEEMSCRDRTHEFMSTVKSMQSRQVTDIFLISFFFCHQMIQYFFNIFSRMDMCRRRTTKLWLIEANLHKVPSLYFNLILPGNFLFSS